MPEDDLWPLFGEPPVDESALSAASQSALRACEFLFDAAATATATEWTERMAAAQRGGDAGLEATYGEIGTWNTGQVTSMNSLFYSYCSTKSTFNADISNWDGKCGSRAPLFFLSHHQLTCAVRLIFELVRSQYLELPP